MNIRTMLEREEGRRNVAYPDPLTGAGPFTIGVGHCGPEVHAGLVWTDEQIDHAFDSDIDSARSKCVTSFPWFCQLNEPRQAVILGMCFQLGLHGLLGFPKMLGAARDERYADAGGQMLASLWAKQTPARARRMAAQMTNGEWQ